MSGRGGSVLIVGAGVGGLAASTLLAQHGVPSLLVEKRREIFVYQKARNLTFRSLEILRRLGVGTQVHYIPVNAFPLYRGLGHDPAATPLATSVAERLVSLPLYPTMTDADVDRVIDVVRAVSREVA